MADLVEYLRARLDERARAEMAKRSIKFGAPELVWTYRKGEPPRAWRPGFPQEPEFEIDVNAYTEVWTEPDPNSEVLADIAVKRAVLNLLADEAHPAEGAWGSPDAACLADVFPGRTCTCGRAARIDRLLRALAQPYSTRPDFDPAWRTEVARG